MTESRYKNRIRIDPASAPHLRGIGLVAYSWSVLEGAIERLIWRTAGFPNDDLALAVTTHTNIQTRLDAANAILDFRFKGSEAANRLKSLDKHIRKHLMGPRNEIVHSRIVGPIIGADNLFIRTVYRARGTIDRRVIAVELSEYEEISEKILAAATEARDIISLIIEMTEPRGSESPS